MNDTKKIGRPRSFDINEALLAAMNVFWSKGYDGASMKDLTRAMGISGPSLYATFGDKRELYLKTIDRYADVNGCEPVVRFEAEPDIKAAVRGFLTAVIEYTANESSDAKGCFLASCVSTNVGEVEGVSDRMIKAIQDTDDRLTLRFERAVADGTLRLDFPSKDRARLLYDMRQGYVFRARAGWTTQQLSKDIEDRINMILS